MLPVHRELLDNAEEYDIDNSDTEEQDHRRQIQSETEPVDVTTEPMPEDGHDPDENWEDDPIDLTSGDVPAVGFAKLPSPKDYKRACITEALKSLQISEFIAIASVFDAGICIDEMINKITAGDFDKPKISDSVEARYAYQTIKEAIFPQFLQCASWQGVDISERTAVNMDLPAISWDMRDANTRKLQKVRELVYGNAIDNEEDADLMSVIEDLEKLYMAND